MSEVDNKFCIGIGELKWTKFIEDRHNFVKQLLRKIIKRTECETR